MTSFETPDALRRRLRKAGLSYEAIQAAWPEWWSEAAIGSPSAEAELRFSLARNLGLAPSALIGAGEATFIWNDQARFKRLTSTVPEQSVLSAFGRAVALAVSSTLQGKPSKVRLSAHEVRTGILSSAQFVTLRELIVFAWALGIPVAYLRVFPLEAKRMDAMSVATPDREVILLARETTSLARLAFILAHELGHVALGHLQTGQTIVDEGEIAFSGHNDDEETAANEYALELLTGQPGFVVEVGASSFNAAELAQAAFDTGVQRQIDPGVIALSAAYSTNKWREATFALKILETFPGVPPQVADNIPATLNSLAAVQLELASANGTSAAFLRSVLSTKND